MEDTKTFNTNEACKAQKKYQDDNNHPDFAPRDGSCFRCCRNIYTEIDHGDYKTGISVEDAGKSLITGCPHCHYSYVD